MPLVVKLKSTIVCSNFFDALSYYSGCQGSQVHAKVPGVRGPGHRLAGRQLRLVSVRESAAVRPRHRVQASGGTPREILTSFFFN